MGHKDYKTINLWLKDLREKEYVTWIYSTHFAEKTKLAIYYLGLNGIRHLKQLITADEDGDEQPTYPIEELRKRYRESTRSQTEADYLSESSYYHFVLGSGLMRPHLCFCKDKYDKNGKEEAILESYLLEVFDSTLPRYRMKKRLGDCVKYLDDEDYEWKEQTDTEKLPILLFVCPRTSDLIYAKRRTRKFIADAWEYKDDDEERPRIRFTTIDKLKQSGVLAKEIWEQA
jgi:hypothetical protein